MTKAHPRPGEAGTGAITAGSGQAGGPAVPAALARFGAAVDRVVPAQLACRIGARARAGERDAWPAVVSIALGTFALVFSELIPVGLLADISGHLGVSVGTGGLMVVVPAVAAAVAAPLLTLCSAPLLTLCSARRAGPAARRNRSSSKQCMTTTLTSPFAAIPRPRPERKELP
jgi:hypothetical protein